MEVFAGLDIGTTKLCAVAVDAARKKLIASVDEPNNYGVKGEKGAGEQDAMGIVNAAFRLLKKLVHSPALRKAKVEGIGVTGQMHGAVLVNKHGKPVTKLVTWQDQRGNERMPGTRHSYVEELAERLGGQALELTGGRPATGYGGVTLLRLVTKGKMPKDTRALTIHDYMVYLLTGRACIDPTDAASWGIFDAAHSKWLDDAAKAVGVNVSVLPEVLPTGSKAGTLTKDAAVAAGIIAGTPVSVALGDNQASFIGSVQSFRDTVLMNLGTGGQMSVPIRHFVRVAGLETRPLAKGMFLLVGASLCGGRAYQIVEHFLADAGEKLFGRKMDGSIYEEMNKLAAKADANCGGLVMNTLFNGTRRDTSLRGTLAGMDANNLTAANFVRAAIGGMIEELAGFYRVAEKAGAKAKHLAGSGNAVRRNPIVQKELEARIKMPLYIPPYQEEAAFGAALSASRCGDNVV
jgi:sedoheptulokinase